MQLLMIRAWRLDYSDLPRIQVETDNSYHNWVRVQQSASTTVDGHTIIIHTNYNVHDIFISRLLCPCHSFDTNTTAVFHTLPPSFLLMLALIRHLTPLSLHSSPSPNSSHLTPHTSHLASLGARYAIDFCFSCSNLAYNI